MARLLRSDPLLAAATFACALLVLAPLLFSPLLPLHDLPDHVGLASQMGAIARGEGVAASFYRVQALPVPYWTSYLVLWLASAAFGPLIAAKVVVALALLAVPLGVVRLAAALGRSPRLALCAFALAWDHNVYWGFVAFAIGVGIALFALANLVERRFVVASLLAVLVAVTHAHALGIFGALALVLSWRAALACAAPAAAVLIPWALSASSGGGPLPDRWIDMTPPWTRLARLFAYSAGTNATDLGNLAGNAVFWPLFLAPALALLPRAARDRRALVLYAAAWALYLGLPMGISWPIEQWYVYPRQATLLIALGLLVPAAPAHRAVAAIGPALALLVSIAASLQLAGFGERAAPFLEIARAAAPDARVLTLTMADDDPATKLSPYNQFHAYLFALHGGYDPHLFDNPGHPVVHRKDRALPHPAWTEMGSFSLDAHARHYDHVLVQGLEKDPIPGLTVPPDLSLEVVREAGRWRLYRVSRK